MEKKPIAFCPNGNIRTVKPVNIMHGIILKVYWYNKLRDINYATPMKNLTFPLHKQEHILYCMT